MKSISEWNNCVRKLAVRLARAITVAGCLLYTANGLAQPGPGQQPLDSWSFQVIKGWRSDQGYLPNSYDNLTFSSLGNGSSLVVDTNVPAWLQYNVVESDGTTNLAVAEGSVTFWYAPGSWSSTNGGPGQCAQLIDVGELTTNAASGYWGLSVDASGQNLWFISQDGAGHSYSLSAPISWTTDYFHFIALTYSPTNVSLYLDGQLATNDPGGLSVLPGPAVLADGFFIGSDTNGLYQAQGLFNSIFTYNAPLDSDTIQSIYDSDLPYYEINPFNVAMNFSSAPSSPSTNGMPDAISGAGYLQWDGAATNCSYSANPYDVWITSVSAAPVGSGGSGLMFSIDGGQSGYLYDVFASAAMVSPITNGVWNWMGQGAACNTYTLTNLNSADVIVILGTPQDSQNSGLTDAYQYLITHTDPTKADADPDGIPVGWDVLLGLNPQMNNVAYNHTTYGYTTADWVNSVTGVRTGTIVTDPEGNVTQVSQ